MTTSRSEGGDHLRRALGPHDRRLWAAVQAGRARVWQARQVAKRTRQVGLTRSQAAWVDAQTTPYLSSLPWTRFSDLLDAKTIEVDPKAAEARAEAAALDRFVTTGQSTEHGLKTLIAKAEAGEVIYFVAICDRIAQILALQGDTDPIGVRRSKAIGILANPARALKLLEQHATPTPDQDPVSASDLHPAQDDSDDRQDRTDPVRSESAGGAGDGRGGAAVEGLWPGHGGRARDERAGVPETDATPRPSDNTTAGDPTPFTRPAAPAASQIDPAKLLPKAVLYVHVSREAFDAALAGELSGAARMEGVGPLTTGQAAAFLGHSHVTVTEVIDLETDHPVDAYETPGWMREQLRLRSPPKSSPTPGWRPSGWMPTTPDASSPRTRAVRPGRPG